MHSLTTTLRGIPTRPAISALIIIDAVLLFGAMPFERWALAAAGRHDVPAMYLALAGNALLLAVVLIAMVISGLMTGRLTAHLLRHARVV